MSNEVLGHCLDELAPPSRTLLTGIYEMVKDVAEKQDGGIDEVYFTRRMIREHIGWNDWQIKAHVKQLEELEYLYVRIGSRGKEYAYALNYKGQGEECSRFYMNLTSVKEIKKLMDKGEK